MKLLNKSTKTDEVLQKRISDYDTSKLYLKNPTAPIDDEHQNVQNTARQKLTRSNRRMTMKIDAENRKSSLDAGRFESNSLNQIAVFCINDINWWLNLCSKCPPKYAPFTLMWKVDVWVLLVEKLGLLSVATS